MEGGHTNSLGRAQEVLNEVLEERSRLSELYVCIKHEDAWVRMRAIDTVEKICRVHPEWIDPYIDNMINELTSSEQASIRWHLAQIFKQVQLSDSQRALVIDWLAKLLLDKDIDWIVSANSMDTLAEFSKAGYFPSDKLVSLLKVQLGHKSNAIKKRANKLLVEFA